MNHVNIFRTTNCDTCYEEKVQRALRVTNRLTSPVRKAGQGFTEEVKSELRSKRPTGKL